MNSRSRLAVAVEMVLKRARSSFLENSLLRTFEAVAEDGQLAAKWKAVLPGGSVVLGSCRLGASLPPGRTAFLYAAERSAAFRRRVTIQHAS